MVRKVGRKLKINPPSLKASDYAKEAVSQLVLQMNYSVDCCLKNTKKISAANSKHFFTLIFLKYPFFFERIYSCYIFQPASLAINPETPIILIIRAMLKQLDRIDISALTPASPRNRKLPTFRLCLI